MLPDKPEQVRDVSDRLWEAALDKAHPGWHLLYPYGITLNIIIKLAACLILLGEVKEPRDPLDEAIEAAYRGYHGFDKDDPIDHDWRQSFLVENIRTHLGPFLKGEG